ncbi:DUF5753 domain-containing protein [Lentzea sp. BCCO 10_0061]|uniref:DUF5753 domain-containing protein n=1 Tax=Lentzea sokolovensis TaxID=3095429 RepID=A0ABU4UPR9_9PSEU|nr:DUF5753 domain-containing protein [Lentzea sp. BCCO 10_0061]MDX8141491.1 DUF5753 domain-containing protein [Lentzea sp. BCCO 10_0061]
MRTLQRPQRAIFDPAEDFPLLMADATQLRTFAVDTVLAIFQLVEYMTATMQRDGPTKAAQLSRVRETWATRSNSDDPVAVEAVFPEAVLCQVVGGGRVLKAQLLRLMEVSELPEVSVRVVPHSAAVYPSMSCPFTWLSFPHRQHNDVAYAQMFLRSEYVETQAEIELVAERFSALRALSLDEGASLELIAEAVTRV